MSEFKSWRELMYQLVVVNRFDGQLAFQPLVSGQNIKIACLELFNEQNLDYSNLNKCITKLHQAEDILNEKSEKFSKY